LVDCGGRVTVVDLRQWRLARLHRHNAEMLETLNDLSQCVRHCLSDDIKLGAAHQSSGRYGGAGRPSPLKAVEDPRPGP
jgi:hypothetical protein